MEIASATNASTGNSIIPTDQAGFAGLDSDAFMRLLITELQNQDPTEPLSNEDLLNQLSMMRNLQSNIELGDALKAITTNQQLSTATAFIGKTITGLNLDQLEVSGVVDRAFLSDGQAYLGIGSETVAVDQVSSVHLSDG